ncbi:MAG TPA: glycosyltransferase [Acidimicrobiia bacterium]|nr:glycosyltransferase [Acidimicrobiia bacterium]
MTLEIAIITTAHWSGDPRLNRHLKYLAAAGHSAELVSFAEDPRVHAVRRALGEIARSRSSVVFLPDPETWVLGSLLARVTRKRPIIDIHENYSAAAKARPWVPGLLRPIVSIVAAGNERIGRWVAWRALVAAPELATGTDYLATNVPDPTTMSYQPFDGSRRLVYIGDVTESRGARTMLEVLATLDDSYDMTWIGNVSESLLDELTATANDLGIAERLHITGRQIHSEAWGAAAGALAGLNLLMDVPAYRDAVATKLWEYMAVGLPPIVSDLPGQRRVVGNVDPRLVCATADAAAEAIDSLASDVDRRERLGRVFREHVEAVWAESRPDLAVQSIVEP